MTDPASRDIVLFVGTMLVALLAGWLTVRKSRPDMPVWPVRLYLWFFRHGNIVWLHDYPDTRKKFSWREQFLTSVFVWFFILFVVAILAFGCSRRVAC